MFMLDRAMRLLLALQGKGYGSMSIRREVGATRRFVAGGVLFDVGANRGSYARELLRQYSRNVTELHVFEPSKSLVKQYLTFDDPRVRVNELALSSTCGGATLFSVRGNSGLNSLTKRRLDHFGTQMDGSEEVETLTLDEYVTRNKVGTISLLKLDVEGHELDVLTGARNCLQSRRIDCVQFEFGGCNIDTRVYFQDFWYFLTKEHSFDLYRITPLGISRLKQYSELDEIFLTTNFLAVKR